MILRPSGWKWASALICTYGFFKAVRPSEPFLTDFLGPPLPNSSFATKNFSLDVLYGEVYPFWTYSYLIALIPIFILTDLLRYQAVLIVETLTMLATWALIIWGTSVLSMQLMQVCYGIATGCEVAYFSYIYAAIDQKHYQTVTSYVRSALLFGRFFGYGIGQLLISTKWGNYYTLNYVSLISLAITLPIALILPPTKSNHTDGTSWMRYARDYLINLRTQFLQSYSIAFVLKWSLWWALATCGFLQVGNYIQSLWSELLSEDVSQPDYNGLVEMLNALLQTGVVFSVQYINADWASKGELVLAVSSTVQAGLVFWMSATKSMIVCYILYVVYRSIYQMLITVAICNVASQLKSANYGLVFGFNWFIALALQTVLTFAVADANGMHLNIRLQFVVYSIYHVGITMIYVICMIPGLVNRIRNNRVR